MRNILFLLLLAVLSCSSDDDNNNQRQTCQNITGLSASCTPDCMYMVTYEDSEGNETTVEVSESAYDYYSDIVNDNIEEDCWVGANP